MQNTECKQSKGWLAEMSDNGLCSGSVYVSESNRSMRQREKNEEEPVIVTEIVEKETE